MFKSLFFSKPFQLGTLTGSIVYSNDNLKANKKKKQ